MIEVCKGIIEKVEFGLCEEYPFLLGLELFFAIDDGIKVNTVGTHLVNVNDKKSRAYQTGVMIDDFLKILTDAGVHRISELVGIPVEITFDDHCLKGYRISVRE